MVLDSISLAIEEKRKWEQRQKTLMKTLKTVRQKKKHALIALQNALRWYSYYTGMMNALSAELRPGVRGEPIRLPQPLNR